MKKIINSGLNLAMAAGIFLLLAILAAPPVPSKPWATGGTLILLAATITGKIIFKKTS